MANELPNGNGTDAANAAPSLNALIQYTKDFSFENPKAPRVLAQQEAQQGPQMSLQVNVSTTPLGDTDYETVLKLDGRAEINGENVFAFDLSYGGVFRLQNIPQEHIHPGLVIDNGVLPADQPVEQCRFADIRPPDDGNGGGHDKTARLLK